MAKLPETAILPFDEKTAAGWDSSHWSAYFRELVRTLKRALEETARVVNANDGFSEPAAMTIASGGISIPADGFRLRMIMVDTQNEASSDDLSAIEGGRSGDMVLLCAASDARTVVVISGSTLRLNGNFTMDSTAHTLLLACSQAGVWSEVSRSSNGA